MLTMPPHLRLLKHLIPMVVMWPLRLLPLKPLPLPLPTIHMPLKLLLRTTPTLPELPLRSMVAILAPTVLPPPPLHTPDTTDQAIEQINMECANTYLV